MISSAITQMASSSPGDPDPDFGFGSGVSVVDVGGKEDWATAVATQADGKILLAGTSVDIGDQRDIFLMRLNENGEPDTSFGEGLGYVVYDLTGGDDYAQCIAIQSDGKIVVGGTMDGGENGYDPFVARFTREGELDDSFAGGTGISSTDFDGSDEAYISVVIDNDGSIITAGYTTDSSGWEDVLVAKIAPNGDLDNEFADGFGAFSHDIGWYDDNGFALCLRPDGGILVAGYCEDADEIGDAFVAAYTANGDIDASFGDEGVAILDNSGLYDEFNAISLGTSGNIIAAGTTVENDQSADFLLASFTSDGASDEQFGDGAGFVTTDVQGGYDTALGLLVQDDGGIILTGTAWDGYDYADFCAVRYTQNGWIDSGFGPFEDGFVIFDLAGDDDLNYGAALQADGQIVLCGETTDPDGNTDVAIVRIEGGAGANRPSIKIEGPDGKELLDGDSISSFGSIKSGSSITRIINVQNVGTGDLSGISLSISGANTSDFTAAFIGGETLLPGERAVVKVVFKPSAAGLRKATLTISSNDEDQSSFDIDMSGTGVSPEIAVMQGKDLVSGKSIADFGTSVVRKNGKSLTFTIRNLGNAKLTGISIKKSGANASDYSVSSLPAISLSPGESMTFKVAFRPSAKGAREASLLITSNDVDESSFKIKMAGRGK